MGCDCYDGGEHSKRSSRRHRHRSHHETGCCGGCCERGIAFSIAGAVSCLWIIAYLLFMYFINCTDREIIEDCTTAWERFYPTDQLDMAMTILHIISIFTTGAALALWIYVTFSRNYTERNIPVCLVLTFTVIAEISIILGAILATKGVEQGTMPGVYAFFFWWVAAQMGVTVAFALAFFIFADSNSVICC